MRSSIAILWIVGFLISHPGQGLAKLLSREFNLGSASAEEVEKAIKPLLSEKGKLVILAQRGSVLVQDESKETLDFVAKVMKGLTAPRPNVRVEISFDESRGGSNFGVGYSRQQSVVYENGRIKVKPIENNVLGGDVSISSRNVTRSTMSKQFLIVRSGHAATLRVGQEVPFVDSFYHYAYANGYALQQQVRWESIGTYLRVKPVAMANGLINVEVSPEISALIDGRRQIIEYRNLSTNITVAPGAEVSLGGFDKASNQFNVTFFQGVSKGSGGSSGSFRLKASLQ